MAQVSIFAVAAFVGDGSAGNPRRPTIWGRLDNVAEVINTGGYCLKPDGTVDVSRISQVGLAMGIVYDFGPCGVVTQGMEATDWDTIRSYLQTKMGYVVWGDTIDELKLSAQEAIATIQTHLAPAGVTLSGTGTLFDQVVEWLTGKNFTGPNSTLMKGIRDYYVDLRLQPVSITEAPDIVYKLSGDSLDPAKFAALMSTWDGVQATDLARVINELYDLACFDLVVRSLP